MAAILVIVQDSLAVAFSLAGIAGLVRFRSALDDTKDAMYVFVAIAVGLGAGVGTMEAAATLAGLYNLVAVSLWWWNSEPQPIAEMALGEQKVPKARSLLQALLPFRHRERHPEPVAEWLKPGEAILLTNGPSERSDHEGEDSNGTDKRDGILRVHAADDLATRRTVEEVLDECTKRWTLDSDGRGENGFPTLTYQVRLKKRCESAELLAKLQDRLGPELAQYSSGGVTGTGDERLMRRGTVGSLAAAAALLLLAGRSAAQGSGALAHYDLRGSGDSRVELGKGLAELSGLAFTADGRLLGHGDEKAVISQIDPADGAPLEQFTFTGPHGVLHGDFEDIQVVGERIFLVTSGGEVYEGRERCGRRGCRGRTAQRRARGRLLGRGDGLGSAQPVPA